MSVVTVWTVCGVPATGEIRRLSSQSHVATPRRRTCRSRLVLVEIGIDTVDMLDEHYHHNNNDISNTLQQLQQQQLQNDYDIDPQDYTPNQVQPAGHSVQLTTGNQLLDSWMVSSGLCYRVFIARGGFGLYHGCGRAHCGIADPTFTGIQYHGRNASTIDRCHGSAPEPLESRHVGTGMCRDCGAPDHQENRRPTTTPAVLVVASRGSIVFGSSAEHRMGAVATFLDR